MPELLDEVVKTVVAVMATALAPVIVAMAVQFLRKLNLDVNAEQQAKLQYLTLLIISEVEEYASQRVRAGCKMSPGEKLERAITRLLDRVPGITRAEAADIVHAQLPAMGIGAASALTGLRRAATNGMK